MARAKPVAAETLTPLGMAYKALSTPERPIGPDTLARLPQVSVHLDKLDEVLGRDITVYVSRLDPTGKLVLTNETIKPFGAGDKLRTCWHRLLAMSDIPEALRLADLYYSQATIFRDELPLEAYCYAADINPLRVVEWLTAILVRQGVQASTMLAATWHPAVVKKTIDMALTDKGTAERAMLHKATGFLPTPKGSQTIVNVQPGSANAPVVVVAPSPEKTISQLAGAFNEERGLPPPPVVTVDASADDAEVEEDDA
jgi:hypothetical protein